MHVGSKTASLVFRVREDPENEVVATARNLKCKLLKTSLGKYGKPFVVIAKNAERRGGNVLDF